MSEVKNYNPEEVAVAENVAGMARAVVAFTAEVDGATHTFWKPEESSASNGCVSVAPLEDGGVLVGDSKNPDQAPLHYLPHEWDIFVRSMQDDQS